MDFMTSETEATDYKQEGTKDDQSFLDPHHTHFILVDENEDGSEIDFRAKFESREQYSGNNTHNLLHFMMVMILHFGQVSNNNR